MASKSRKRWRSSDGITTSSHARPFQLGITTLTRGDAVKVIEGRTVEVAGDAGPAAPRARLGVNMLANALSAFSTLAVAAIMTPLVLDRLGTAAFGVWTVIGSVVLYLVIAESGFGPAVQRYVAVSHAHGDLRQPAALMWTMLAAYAVAGALLCAVLQLLAADIVSVFAFPVALRGDAVGLLSLVSIVVPLALAATGLGNVLFGLERFIFVSVSSSLGATALLGTTLVALDADAGLRALGYGLLAQQAVLLVLRAAALWDVVASGRPAFASRAQVRAVTGFSAKLQLSALTVLINGQSDRVVAGLAAPVVTVGRLGIAGQVAEAGRLVAGALLQPVVSRLSSIAAHGDRERLEGEYRRLSRVWIVAMLGATAVGLGLLHPLLLSWLGPGYDEALVFATVLVVAYGINIVTGIGSAYLRATGAVGIEVRTGILMVGLNLLFTIPLAIAAGALGVVAGTLAANVLGTAWFFWRLHAIVPLALPSSGRCLRVLALAALAGAATLGAGSVAATTLPRFVAMLPVGIAAAVSLAGYLVIALGLRPIDVVRRRGAAASARTAARRAPD
jgi:O-antigen/teichoic acid export membrane protein